MTLHEALEMVRRVGEVEIRGGNLRLKYLEEEQARLQPAIATLRGCKAEALSLLAENSRAAEAAEMSKTTQDTSKLSATRIPAQTAKSAPATSADSAETEPSPEELAHAATVLTKAGIRLMRIEGVDMVGIWSDLDGPEVRAALRVHGSDRVPVRYLDGDVPMRFKLRRVPGEPVPQSVLTTMEKHAAEPWKVRDRMLEEMSWTPQGIPWATWKAEKLNQLFCELGKAGQPAKIQPETVGHGERGRK
jgi:hypothetical protein